MKQEQTNQRIDKLVLKLFKETGLDGTIDILYITNGVDVFAAIEENSDPVDIAYGLFVQSIKLLSQGVRADDYRFTLNHFLDEYLKQHPEEYFDGVTGAEYDKGE